MVLKAELCRVTLFSFAVLRLGLFCSYFLPPPGLLALLIFLYLTNTDILGMVGIVIFNGQGPSKGDFNIFNWLLMVL
jgi:hypothetical protein